MFRLLIALSVCVVAVAAITPIPASFDEYLVKFDKHYTPSEYRHRKRIYELGVQDVISQNMKFAAGKSTHTATVNKFTDHTEAEMASLFGLNRNAHFGKIANLRAPVAPRRVSSLPDSLDWTTKGATTHVKNQGGCGSCWAFAGTEAVESCAFINTGSLVKLAPQEYVDCVVNSKHCGGSGGCEGATPDQLFEYAIKEGAVRESDYPYQGMDGMCHMSDKKSAVKVGGFKAVLNNDYDAMMQAVNVNPIAIGVAANAWASYDSGVMSFDDCGSEVNHAVLLVGYGTDADLGPYWKVQNSWGTQWGEDGFIRLARSTNDSNNCQMDNNPLDGFGCKGGPASVNICGTCGLLYAASYPTNCSAY